MNSQTTIPSTLTTLAEGGSCHMGRPAQASAPVPGNCTLLLKNSSVLIVSCNGANVTLSRPRSPSVPTMLNSPNRSRCSNAGAFACTAPPLHYSGTALPQQEVSYGQLWRWAPARLLARDLRMRLCGNATNCAQSTKWTLQTFWQSMMQNTVLGATPKTASASSMFNVPAAVPNSTWDSQWMLCTTNASGTMCSGTMSQQQWVAGNKTQQCMQVLNQPNTDSATLGVNVCELDDDMANLCTAIQAARYSIFQANCQLTDKCLTSAFFYQPATYGIDDSQFVRSTVGYFYNFTEAGSCPADNNETLHIIAQNKVTAQNCAATDLQALQYAITAARAVLNDFVQLVYYCGFIMFDVIQLVGATDTTSILKDIQHYLNLIVSTFVNLFQTLGDMAYKIVMQTGKLGQWIQTLVVNVCNFLNNIFINVVRPMLCAIKDAAGKVMDAVLTIIGGINTFLGGALDGFEQTVATAKANMETGFDCNMSSPFGNCQQILPPDADLPATLPMPTRCWTGYIPSVGEQQSLGCTASDTCVADDGVTLVVCATCSGSTAVEAYGCDSVTKLCSCHVAPVSQDTCSSNGDCYLDGIGCQYVNQYLLPTYGSVQCSSCLNTPVCIVKSGSSGVCSCMLQQATAMQCQSSAVGQLILADPTQLCLASLGLSSSSSSTYTADMNALAMAPCSVLNEGQTYCLNVYVTASTSMPMIVGLQLLSSRRRLLQLESFVINATVNTSEWRRAHEPCRSLMLHVHWTEFGPVDQYTRSECERWHAIGSIAIGKYNLTSIPAVAFTSWAGLAEALSDPDATLQVTRQLSNVLPWLLSHAHSLQPAIRWAKATWRLLPNVTQKLGPSNSTRTRQAVDLLPWMQNVTHRHSMPIRRRVHYPNVTSGRQLLQTSWKSELQADLQLSINVADGTDTPVNYVLANAWASGPFQWPPEYSYYASGNPCMVASIIWNVSYYTIQTTVQYYETQYTLLPVARTFADCVPTFNTSNAVTPSSTAGTILASIGISTAPLTNYLVHDSTGESGLSRDLKGLVTCDFLTVQLCSGFRRSLGWSMIVVAMGCLMVAVAARQLSIPYVEIAILAMYWPLVFYYVFGMSMACAPMVPTCLLDEVTGIVESLLPSSLTWPTQLQQWANCTSGIRPLLQSGQINYALLALATPGTASCFKSCTDWPFNFQTWEDNVAWAGLQVMPTATNVLSSWLKNYNYISVPSPLSWILQPSRFTQAVAAKSLYLGWDDMQTAQNICCGLTGFNVVPLFFGLVAVLIALIGCLALPFLALQACTNVLLSLLVYVHTR